MNEVFLVD